jgi:glutamate dehydrogenase (NAD(P)+)
MQKMRRGDGYEIENPRRIATERAKQVVYRAMLLRKGAISVAREAYARKDRISD